METDQTLFPVRLGRSSVAGGGVAWGEARPNSFRPRGAARAAPMNKAKSGGREATVDLMPAIAFDLAEQLFDARDGVVTGVVVEAQLGRLAQGQARRQRAAQHVLR